jgi:uncharacterized protein (TIGR03790 family)
MLMVCAGNMVWAQSGLYDDVGVIVNIRDANSIEIADYFMARRSIPAGNRINISVPVREEINQLEFDSLQAQVESAIFTQGLGDKLNYLVTTKGVPLKILRADPDHQGCNASVESELMLLHPLNELYIGECSSGTQIFTGDYFGNPYFNQEANFAAYLYGMYLVTRLDAYTVEQVKSLIDRSGPLTYVNQDSVQFVLDQAENFKNNPLNQAFVTTDEMLRGRGWKVHLNTDSVFVTGKDSVLGYASWGSNDSYADSFAVHAKPGFSWVNGSIAETHVSTSGRSFTPGTAYGQSLIADLIEEGACGAKGYVYEPFTTAIAISNILFERYTRTTNEGRPRFNLAESYFAASQLIGWMDVVVGDPKTTITNDRTLGFVTPAQGKQGFNLYPNPAGEGVTIGLNSHQGPAHLLVRDLSGRLLLQRIFNSPDYKLSLADLQPGAYLVSCDGETRKLIKGL